MHKHILRFLLALGFLSLLAIQLPAQSSGSGAISGVVTDPSGAVVPDAQITVKNLQTGETRVVHSTSQGAYTISALQPGDYSVEVTKSGFKKTVISPFTVHTTNTEALNIKFEVGTMSESVSVEANAERLQLESASLGHVTTQDVIESLPLVTRNFTEIIGLNPGVSTEINNAGDLGRGNGGNPTSGEVSAAGTSGMDNSFQFNGVVVNDFQESGAFSGGIPIPNPDTIREFKVQTAPYDASYGRDAGANVNVVTRTGQNAFHGTAFEFLRNEDMNANTYFRNEAKQARPELRQNQFGFTVGGPVLKDRLFFFGSYQGTRQQNGLDSRCSSTFFEPPITNDRSAAALGAIFAGQPTFWQEATGLKPGQPGAGVNVAPNGSNISPVALALLNLKLANGQYVVPTPQTVDPSKPFAQQGFSSISSACPFNEDQGMINLQWNQSAKSTWEVRGFRVNSNEVLTLNYIQLGGAPVPGFPTNVPNKFRDASIANSYILNSNLLNHLLLGWHEDLTATTQATPFSWGSLGATVNSFDILPQISVAGSVGVGGNGQTISFAQDTYQLQDDVSWNHGRHTFRFGAGGERYNDHIKYFNFLSGTIFETWPDLLLGESAAQNGTAFSNVIASVDLPGILARVYRATDWNAYGQDDVHVTQRLTLNLGFRFERLGDVGELSGRNANFDFSAANPNPPASGSLQGFVVANNFPGTVPAGVVTANNNLAFKGIGQNTLNPRVGVAWQLPGSDKVVLRAGYGVYHQRYAGQPLVQTLTNQPWSITREPQAGNNANASLAQPFAPLSVTFPDFIPYTPPPPGPVCPNCIGGEVFDQNFRPPMIQHYSLNIQDQLGRDTVLEIGYLGSRGTRLMSQVLPNEALLATPGNPVHGVTTNSWLNANQRALIPGISITGFVDLQSSGQSWYNALESSLIHRTRFGLQMQASYTWAHSLSDIVNALNGTNGGTLVGDTYNRHHDYGTDAFIRPQRLVVSFNYAEPFFRSNSRSFIGETLGGWGLSGVYTVQTGQRLAVTSLNAKNVNGIQTDFGQIVPGCNTATSGSIENRLNNYINTKCFVPYPTIAADGTTGFGNSGPGVVIGPGENNFNAALIKTFHIKTWTESSNLEFRAEAFNVFNHPQFANPNTSQNSSAFGTITSLAVNPRVLQLALKFNF